MATNIPDYTFNRDGTVLYFETDDGRELAAKVQYDPTYETLAVIEHLTPEELEVTVDGQVTDKNSGEVVELSADIRSSITAIVHDHATHMAIRNDVYSRAEKSANREYEVHFFAPLSRSPKFWHGKHFVLILPCQNFSYSRTLYNIGKNL